MKSIITLNNVWKVYHLGDVRVEALRGVNLDIPKGEFISILGASGSGKSTLMSLIGALDIPTDGSIYLDGHDIAELSESTLATIRGRKIGFVFQQFNLIQTLTALENVMLPLDLQEMPNSRERALQLLETVGLGNRINHKPKELSGGQQQRVAIARALANDPEVILADEPTGNLDSQTGEEIMNLLIKLHLEGRTIILVTHDIELVKHAERVVHIKDGQITSLLKDGRKEVRKK